jgi:hypothetical protein
MKTMCTAWRLARVNGDWCLAHHTHQLNPADSRGEVLTPRQLSEVVPFGRDSPSFHAQEKPSGMRKILPKPWDYYFSSRSRVSGD